MGGQAADIPNHLHYHHLVDTVIGVFPRHPARTLRSTDTLFTRNPLASQPEPAWAPNQMEKPELMHSPQPWPRDDYCPRLWKRDGHRRSD